MDFVYLKQGVVESVYNDGGGQEPKGIFPSCSE